MGYPMRTGEQRKESRLNMDLPAQISVGTQLALHGKLKDLSSRSAFITIKNSVYLEMNDEVGFSIQRIPGNVSESINGFARISRIAIGEGLAIYFTKMDESSATRLRELLK